MLRSTTLYRLTPFLGLLAVTSAMSRAPESIAANDNRHVAGSLGGKVFTIKLEAREGLWRPEGENGRAIPVAAFAEEGRPLTNPGPLIRVAVGTEVRATIHNTLAKPLILSGLGKTRGMSDSVIVPANGRVNVSFTAATPGTYYYVGRRGLGPFGTRPDGDFELNGAIVVDPPNTTPTDRVFVISWWFTVDSTSKTGLGRSTMAINGLSWPHTERIDLVQGRFRAVARDQPHGSRSPDAPARVLFPSHVEGQRRRRLTLPHGRPTDGGDADREPVRDDFIGVAPVASRQLDLPLPLRIAPVAGRGARYRQGHARRVDVVASHVRPAAPDVRSRARPHCRAARSAARGADERAGDSVDDSREGERLREVPRFLVRHGRNTR